MLDMSDPINYNELLHGLLMAICEEIHDDSKHPADIYGDNYENDTFKMNRYCWCDGDDCKLCGDDPEPNFIHKHTGFKVWWYKYIGRGFSVTYAKSSIKPSELLDIFSDCIKSVEHDNLRDAEDVNSIKGDKKGAWLGGSMLANSTTPWFGGSE